MRDVAKLESSYSDSGNVRCGISTQCNITWPLKEWSANICNNKNKEQHGD